MSTTEEVGAKESYTETKSKSPPSQFTAVNGREPSGSAPPTNSVNSNAVPGRVGDERPNGQPRNNPPGQEKLTITTTTTSRKQEWVPPRPASATDAERANVPDRPVYPASGSYSGENPHKRKRSGSVDQNSSSANSYHSHAMPSSTKQTPTTASTDTDGQRDDNLRGPPAAHPRDVYSADTAHPREAYSADTAHPREPYSADVQYRRFMSATDDGREPASASDLWQPRHFSHSHMNSDDHLREVLQNASHNMDAQRDYDREQGTPNSDDRSAYPHSAPGYDRREMSVQSDPKKRKRNFGNRTKTGCMTCRRRKKKCDETMPECNNCLRGGFVCSGYQQRGQWPKAEQKQPPVPLQSKNEFDSSGYVSLSPYGNSPMGNSRREPLPGYRGQTLRVDPSHRKSIDDEPLSTASILSPENTRLSAISFSQQTPTPISASNSVYAERHAKAEYQRMGSMGSIHEISRQEQRGEQDTGTPQSAKSSMNHILHPQLHAERPRTAQVAAQLALSHPASSTTRARTQKEEMLAGHHYFPFDKELVLERERCNGACWRFNSSTNPNNGVSPEERARLFRDILQPRDHVISPTQASPVTPVGHVGNNVVVEAPFNCDYGYNISIGQDVAIGKNCTILDTCEVKIGDRCNIGPNVNIYTASLPIDPKRRLGSRGPSLGSKINIESDCWIGGGVTILPGRTIGKGSVVGAGSVVTRDVPPYTVACGNPDRVSRGVHPPELSENSDYAL